MSEEMSKPLDNLSGASVRGDAYDPNSDAWSGAAVRGEAVAKPSGCEFEHARFYGGTIRFDVSDIYLACSFGFCSIEIPEGMPKESYARCYFLDCNIRNLSDNEGDGNGMENCTTTPVSARAADAPSESSELDDWTIMQICAAFPGMARSNSMSEIIGFANAVRTFGVKSRAADALDSQPTEPYDLQGNEQYRMQMAGISSAALGYVNLAEVSPEYMTQPLRDVVALYEKYVELASSQPTDGGVRNG